MPAPILTPAQMARVAAGWCACGCLQRLRGRQRYASPACRARSYRDRLRDPRQAREHILRLAEGERELAAEERQRARRLYQRAAGRRRRAAALERRSSTLPEVPRCGS